MAPTPDGGGYWLVASDGGVFSYGDAAVPRLDGEHAAQRNPVVGMASTPDGGRLLAGGRPTAACSPSATPPSTARRGRCAWPSPSRPWPSTPDGGGYWLVAADGGVFSFGDRRVRGVAAGRRACTRRAWRCSPPAPAPGYLIVTTDGRAVDFGDAPQFGDVADVVVGYTGHLVGGAAVAG